MVVERCSPLALRLSARRKLPLATSWLPTWFDVTSDSLQINWWGSPITIQFPDGGPGLFAVLGTY